MSFNDDEPSEKRGPPELKLDEYWKMAFTTISEICGLDADFLYKKYEKLLQARNMREERDKEVYRVPAAQFPTHSGSRACQSIDIVHEPGKLFKVKVVIIDYGGDEVYFVGNTSARHFYDSDLKAKTEDDGVSCLLLSAFVAQFLTYYPRSTCPITPIPLSLYTLADPSSPQQKEFPDRSAYDDCALMLRCEPDKSPTVAPCCDRFKKCIKKRDLLCKWEQSILDNDPRRKKRDEEKNNGGGFGDFGSGTDTWGMSGGDNVFGGDAGGDAGGVVDGWGAAAQQNGDGGFGGDAGGTADWAAEPVTTGKADDTSNMW
jgi:hypothetical protein